MGMVWLKLGYEETLDMPMPLLEHLYKMEIDRQHWIAGRPFEFKGTPKPPRHRLTPAIFDRLFARNA